MRNQKRARTFTKLHHPDPSGFWNLVRTGEKLPVVGQQILYVVDIRGTLEEVMQEMLVRVADGDPYRCGLVGMRAREQRVLNYLETRQYRNRS